MFVQLELPECLSAADPLTSDLSPRRDRQGQTTCLRRSIERHITANSSSCRFVSLAQSGELSASLFVQLLPVTSDTVNRL